MWPYLCRRAIFMLLTLWAVTTFTFIIMHIVPGTPFQNPKIPEAIQETMIQYYGLDRPLLDQYFLFISRLVQGDLGFSFYYRDLAVGEIIRQRFPVSALIGLSAFIIALGGGIILGTIAALHKERWPDHLVTVSATLALSIPHFVLAILLQYIFATQLEWLPAARWGSFKHTLLPTLSLAAGALALFARHMRSSMLEVWEQDYIFFARAKGLPLRQIIWGHALPNALPPLISLAGPLLAAVVTGSFVIEHIFAIPGLSKFLVESIYNRDYPVIIGITVFYTFLLILSNFLCDLCCAALDPRLREGKQQ